MPSLQAVGAATALRWTTGMITVIHPTTSIVVYRRPPKQPPASIVVPAVAIIVGSPLSSSVEVRRKRAV